MPGRPGSTGIAPADRKACQTAKQRAPPSNLSHATAMRLLGNSMLPVLVCRRTVHRHDSPQPCRPQRSGHRICCKSACGVTLGETNREIATCRGSRQRRRLVLKSGRFQTTLVMDASVLPEADFACRGGAIQQLWDCQQRLFDRARWLIFVARQQRLYIAVSRQPEEQRVAKQQPASDTRVQQFAGSREREQHRGAKQSAQAT
jgi:hypothetical protein